MPQRSPSDGMVWRLFGRRGGGGGGGKKRKEKKPSKSNLPVKECVVCGRPFTWRKKWERCWDEVTTCSKSCNRKRRSQSKSSVSESDGVPSKMNALPRSLEKNVDIGVSSQTKYEHSSASCAVNICSGFEEFTIQNATSTSRVDNELINPTILD